MKRLLLQLSAAVLMLCACVFSNAQALVQDEIWLAPSTH